MILLHKPYRTDLALEKVKDCLDTSWVSTAGAYVNAFEDQIARLCETKYAVATASGTAALHLALVTLGIGKGDLVLVPNLTFVATVNPVRYAGATPLLVDVEEDSWQMDLDLLETFLEKQTYSENHKTFLKETKEQVKAVIPVHLLGNVMDMSRVNKIARKYHLKVIEDAAESLGAKWKNLPAGSMGNIGCLSFNGNKIITTGGGGMILTNDESLAKMARHVSTQAKTHPTEYFHDQVGYNYRMNNMAAALGLSQLELFPEIMDLKRKVFETYQEKLGEYSFQKIFPGNNSNHWLITIRAAQKEELLLSLQKENIQARSLWLPLNRQPMYQQERYISNHDISWKLYETCVSLPSSPDLTSEEIGRITKIIKTYR